MSFDTLESVIRAPEFPPVDIALRRGRHIDVLDGEWYAFLHDARHHLEPFYERYHCELVYRTDAFVFLIPRNDELGRRHLTPAEMLVGQMLALMRLDPSTTASGGIVTSTQVIDRLHALLQLDGLVRTLGISRTDRYDERKAREKVISRLHGAIREMKRLGFVDSEGERHRLRASLMRFIDPVRDATRPQAALERLMIAGHVVIAADPPTAHGHGTSDDGIDGEDEAE